MRERILDAAVRVLHDDGALGFTTTRVAEEAGISVGSLYQYFPNKHALVVAIHQDAIRNGWTHVRGVLDDGSRSPRQKVIDIAKWFFATESADAAELGAAFEDVDVFLRDRAGDPLDEEAATRFTIFVSEAGRRRSPAQAEFDAQLLMTTLETLGKELARRPLAAAEREQWALAAAGMLCDHLGIEDD
jgi:AcrR family transcriptional regulator